MSEQGKTIGAVLCFAATCMSIFTLPFIVCDLYYGYNQPLCGDIPIANSTISFTISTWLKVDGYMLLSSVLLFFLISILVCISTSCLVMAGCYVILTLLYALFRLAWLIIGAVMFWGYLQPNNMCSGPLTSYMWALLIIGFLGVCGSCLNSRQVSSKSSGSYEERNGAGTDAVIRND